MGGFFDKKEVESDKIHKGRSATCAACGLHSNSVTPRLRGTGGFGKQILIIGSASSKEDDAKGKHWMDKPGRYLRESLKENGINLEHDCLSINSVGCYCEEAPTPIQIECCRKNIIKIIEDYKPKVVILVGESALYSVIGNRWKGKMGGMEMWRGWTIPDQDYKTWICPIQHPSYVQRKYHAFPEVEVIWKQDLARAICMRSIPFPNSPEENIHVIEDLSILNEFQHGVVSIDYETTGVKPHKGGHRVVCASVAVNPTTCYVFMMPESPKQRIPFINLLKNPNVKKMAHNMKFEENWSAVRLRQPVQGWYWDSMLAAHILDNRSGITGLKFQTYVTQGVVDYSSEISHYLESGDEYGDNTLNNIEALIQSPGGAIKLMTYCARDTLYQYRLAEWQIESISSGGIDLRKAYKLFHNGTLALARAEQQGICFNSDYAKTQATSLQNQIQDIINNFQKSSLYTQWKRTFGEKTNMDSPTQLSHLLYEIKQIKPPKETKTGKGSVDDETLNGLKLPELDLLLQVRKLKKLKDTYLLSFLKEQIQNVIHPCFNLNTVITYRSSSNSPNFQNIPKHDKIALNTVRGALYARPGNKLMEIDFSGLEVSIAACYHKDPVMIDYLVNGKDLHSDMAAQIFMIKNFNKHVPEHKLLRYAAKNGFVFAQFYGDYYKNNAEGICKHVQLPVSGSWKRGAGIGIGENKTISDHLIENKIKSFDDFVEHLRKIEDDFWNNRFRVYGQWKRTWLKEYQNKGYFQSKTGFMFKGEMKKNEVINYPVQGAAFHCLLWSLIELDRYIQAHSLSSRIIGQIHDSIVIDVVPEEQDVLCAEIMNITTRRLLEEWKWISVPLSIDADITEIDQPWSTMVEYDIRKH